MPSIKRILCPVDFSDASLHAVDHALALGRWYGARVIALHVSSRVAEPALSAAGRASVAESAGTMTLLGDVVRAFGAGQSMGVSVDPFVAAGDPVSEILETATSLTADLIVMGTHGSSGFARFVLGSVTEKVLRQASCPVFTVPPRAHATSVLPFKRLLCAVDFSPSSDRALQYTLSLAQRAQTRLTLVHVLEWPWHEPPAPRFDDLPREQAVQLAAFRRARELQATERLAALIPHDVRDWCLPEARVEHGKPYAEILRVATESEADLLVIGVHGHNSLELALLGSTTNQLVRRATCPVLTVRT